MKELSKNVLAALVKQRLGISAINDLAINLSVDFILSSIDNAEYVNPLGNEVVRLTKSDTLIEGKKVGVQNLRFVPAAEILRILSTGAVTFSSVITQSWLIPFVLILLVSEINGVLSQNLSRIDAMIVYAFSELSDSESSRSAVVHLIGSEYIAANIPEGLSEEQIQDSLERLTRIGVLVKKGERYMIVERVEVRDTSNA